MSFQDYVNHISQKYRLAVAISVIKTKPDNLSIDEYLTRLQNKIKNEEIDPNETICSEDFNFDEDDTLHENNDENTKIDTCVMLKENGVDCSVNHNDSEGCQRIPKDFYGDRLQVNVVGETSIGDTLKLLKEVATAKQKDNANKNLSQLTFCESQGAINNTNNDSPPVNDANLNAIGDNNMFLQNCNENNNMDSQATQLYSLHGFTQDYSHVSETPNEYIFLSDKYIRNIANNSNVNNSKDINGAKCKDTQMYITCANALPEGLFVINDDGKEGMEETTNVSQQAMENNCGNTRPYQLLQNVKDIPASNVHKDDANGLVSNNDNEIGIINIDFAQKVAFNANNDVAANKTGNNDTDEAISKAQTHNDRFETIALAAYKGTDIENATPLISFNSHDSVRNEIQNVGNEPKINNSKEHKESTLKSSSNIDNIEQELDENTENIDMDLDESESDENTQETVPFKVIEEMNRVTNYVNKKVRRYDGYSTDSGYRSDSQVRSSLKTSSQLHGAWLNQSAHCLFNHILQATATDDIVKQIAQVLGKLIDRLHEEENYPPFLDELLGTVDAMLEDLRVGGGWDDDVLVTKDEKLQRLLLLNKSKHILKYSIEKITATLEELYTNLIQGELYELTNIVELENVSYIFHILEILLKKYMKVKDTSQSTQNSQGDVFPTRSSLTELWRKKWYPSSNKEIIKNENKTCILKTCSVILNKIIVECMDGYSLVAFAALQCFNVIQG